MTYSIIIPLYNEERTLPTLLQKLNKLDKNIETIIVDDGSTDGTRALLKNDQNLKVIINKCNMGKGFASLAGIYSAKNENTLIMYLEKPKEPGNFILSKWSDIDLHVMNKWAINRISDNLLEYAK